MNQLFSFVGAVRRTAGRVLVMFLKAVFFSLVGLAAGFIVFYGLGGLAFAVEARQGPEWLSTGIWWTTWILCVSMALGCGVVSYTLHRDRNKI